MSEQLVAFEDPPQEKQSVKGKMTQTRHGFVERFFRVTPTRNTAFITKLFSMVEDESIRNLICWTGLGDQFTVFNKNDFSRIVLPRYFKHGNWASFVRQLNMYDFRKVNETSTNGKDDSMEHWDFKHPAFTKTNYNKLHKIRRKSPKTRLQSQIRYSDSMELLPYNYEGEILTGSNTTETSIQKADTPTTSASVSEDNASMSKLLLQLKTKADDLESKIDATNLEVHYLRTVIDNQRVLLSEILDSMRYLRSNNGNTNNDNPREQSSKPTKINDLLVQDRGYSNISFHHYDANCTIGPSVKKRKKDQFDV